MKLPKMVEVRQNFSQPRLEDPAGEIKRKLGKLKIRRGARIAITAGSRGITGIPVILRVVADAVRASGGEPFLIPAMGSHGGATPHGQVEALRSLGVTEESAGCPIVSSMEVDEVGRIDGTPVYCDRAALSSDGIIVVGRVKPHTDFKGEVESGLLKMLAIGLGKQQGAEMIHHHLYDGYHRLLPEAGKLILLKAPVLLGVALLENARHETMRVEVVEPARFEETDRAMLAEAKRLLARLPFREIDVLIVDEIGKNISGVGMDTNVTGRFWMPGESDPGAPRINKIVVLDLTPETHGNAIGIGLADLTTRRVFDKIDYQSTYVNCLTQGTCDTGKTPIWLPSDRDAVETALRVCGPIDPENARIVRIRNTLELERLWVSEALATEAEEAGVEVTGEPRSLQFDVLGALAR